MRRFRMIFLTLAALAVLDLAVAAVLTVAGSGRLAALERYFDYGRSVPGKIEQWRAQPDMPGNLLNVAWRKDIVADSAARFAAEDGGPVLRHYGMSFSNHIVEAAQALRPDLVADSHAGPGAPANFVFALFQDDRANRRPGDVVAIGVLASAVHALAAYSNSSWAFEQPAPMTYPVYAPTAGGLIRREPVATTAAQALSPEFIAQLAADDPHYTDFAFRLSWADRSPFLRLVRRALVGPALSDRKAAIMRGEAGPDIRASLRGILTAFVETARADGQTPVALLIQNVPKSAFDLSAEAGPTLTALGAAFLDTSLYADPEDWRNFVGDGHFTHENNAVFGEELLKRLPTR